MWLHTHSFNARGDGFIAHCPWFRVAENPSQSY